MSWNIGTKDKIGSLSHNAGIISLQPSLITIGGRQYRTTSVLNRTIATDVTLTTNTLYMIFAQVISGAVALRISTFVRSSYLLLNPNSELVGAFYSNGLVSVGFGTFVNIVGTPTTENLWDGGPVSIGALTTAPTKGTTIRDQTFQKRNGNRLIQEFRLNCSNAGSAGSGTYFLQWHSNFQSMAPNNSTQNSEAIIGEGHIHAPGVNFGAAQALQRSSTSAWLLCEAASPPANALSWSSTFYSLSGVNGLLLGVKTEFEVSGWSNTQLLDL